jgi:NRPS condensation-like uncharacterized protein
MPPSPARYPAPAFDVFNVYFERIYDPTIHMLFSFDGELDGEVMREATMKLIASSPYLGSRFLVVDGLPVWEEIPEEQWDRAFSLISAGEREGQPPITPPPPLDVYSGPQLRVTLYRRREGDLLAVTCHHGFCDAHGAATLAQQLFATYRGVMENPDFSPAPTGSYDRSADQILALYNEEEKRRARDEEAPFVDRWHFPIERTGRGTPRVAYRTLSPERLRLAKEFGRKHGATVNDIIIGAFLLALQRIRGDPSDCGTPRSILTSANLRRYLKQSTEHLPTNLSVAFDITLSMDEGAQLEEIVGQVSTIMSRRKAGNLGLACILFYEEIFSGGVPAVEAFFDEMMERYQESGQKNPVFSNLGIFNPGDYLPAPGENGAMLDIMDIQCLPCVCWPYGFLMTASTFCDRMTLMIAYEEGPYSAATVERFLGYVDEYLP